MTDPYHVTIRRLPNGAIDTDYYLARSSRIRSAEAYRLGAAIRKVAVQSWAWLNRTVAARYAKVNAALTLFPSVTPGR